MAHYNRRPGELENNDSDVNEIEHGRTPLPVRQLAILLLLRFVESASTFVIFPFLNELISSVTGGDSAKVGYYVGTMESIRQALSLVSVMYWSRLSDHIGRKPILLLGTLALAVATVSFGLSKTFVGLVVSRCIFTALNSNAGVIKSMVGEITDHTNSADAFALLHVPWAVGSSFGAFVGGWLARPHDHFPAIFSGDFWSEYPYFLPCAIMAAISIFSCAIICLGLNETIGQGLFHKVNGQWKGEPDESDPLLQRSTISTPNSYIEEPVPFKSLLRWNVLLPILNYIYLASLHASSNALQPLFLAMPVRLGGLGLPPRQIGYILAAYGIVNSICQTLMLGRLVRRFGVKGVFVSSITAFVPIFLLSPLMNVVLSRSGNMSYVVWMMLSCQLSCLLVMELGYGCVYLFITAAAPNKRSLGATNGFAQTLVSIGRIITPLMATSVLSLSIEQQIMKGYAAYLLLAILTVGGVWLSLQLPSQLH